MATNTVTYRQIYSINGVSQGDTNPGVSLSSNTLLTYIDTVPNTAVAQPIRIAFDKAHLISMWLLSDQDCTLWTNSSGSPVDSKSLKAGVPQQWDTNNLASNPYSVAITEMFITYGGVPASANVTFIWLVDGNQ